MFSIKIPLIFGVVQVSSLLRPDVARLSDCVSGGLILNLR